MTHVVTNPETGETWTCTGGDRAAIGGGISVGADWMQRCTEMETWECKSTSDRECHFGRALSAIAQPATGRRSDFSDRVRVVA